MKKSYLAGQLDFTTNPLAINVFMQFHPLYHSFGELPKRPGFPFPNSGLSIQNALGQQLYTFHTHTCLFKQIAKKKRRKKERNHIEHTQSALEIIR